MPEVSADCPNCGTKNSLSHYEGTENGAPHGGGYWPMPVSITDQDCDCELTEAEFNAAMQPAWKVIQDQLDADAVAEAQMWANYPARQIEEPDLTEIVLEPCDHSTTICNECVEDPNEGLPPYAR